MTASRSAWERALARFSLFGLVWLAVLALSWFTFNRGVTLGGTAEWAGIFHPVIFGLTAWPVLLRFARGRRWLTIPNAVLGLTYLAMGLGSVYFVFQYNELGHPALRRPGEVRTALLVVLAGIVAYRLGAEVPWFRRIARKLPTLPRTARWSWGVRVGMFTAIILAVCSELYLAATGSFGYVTGTVGLVNTGLWSILGNASDIGLLTLSGAYFYWFSGAPLKRGDRIFLVLATGLLAALGLLSGMKEEFLFVFFGVVIPYMWTRRGRGRRHYQRGREAAFALSLVGVMALIFALNPLYREALRWLGGVQNRIHQGPRATAIVVDRVSRGPGIGPLLVTGVENAWGRLSIFPYHLAVVDQVPETKPFRAFDRYSLLPAMTAVPRILWPNKPANSSGMAFQRRYISTAVVNSTTPTVYGWSYIELGLPGVLLVLFGLGALARLSEDYLAIEHRGNLASVLLYTALFVTLAQIEADPFWQLGGVPKLLVIATLVYSLFAVPERLLVRGPRGRRSSGYV